MARRRPTDTVANPARGAALVVVAVLIGLFLLRNGLDTSDVVTGSPSSGGSTDLGVTDGGSTDEGTTDDGSTTDSTVGVRPPSQVPTIVLNGSGVSGAAKRYSSVLAALAYSLTNPEGGNATNNVQATQVLYGPGYDREAVAVAEALAAASGQAAPTPTPIGTVQPGTTNNAQVVVVLGPDIGSVNPTPGTTSTN
ncbi:MAG: LytR C-terminal domain-containing protein [Actinomycetota bacterium]|nr:LytR C-terminal domain-containing protein [Actinomycetota bacterium]